MGGLCFLAFILFTTGCKITTTSTVNKSRNYQSLDLNAQPESGIISVFLSLNKPEGPHINMELSSIEIKGDGNWVTLAQDSIEINSKKIGAGQIFIGRKIVPETSYQKLRLTFERASLIKNGQHASLSIPNKTVELLLPTSLKLKKGDSHSLFVTWDAENSIEKVITLTPRLSASLQAIPIINNLLFAACPDIDTVYIIRADINRVTASVGISGKPTYLAVDRAQSRLYVLSSEESAIKVVDVTTNRVVDKIFITLDYKPDFMTLNEERQSAYILDSLGNTVVLIDLASGATIEREIVDYNPQYAVYLAEEKQLAVSLSRSNAVNLLNSETLTVNTNILTGNSPLGLAGREGVLYITESINNTLLAYNLKNQSQGEQITVGFAPARILPAKNLIYVANSASGSISVVSPQIFQVIREVPVANKVGELSASINYNWLYAGSEDAGGITAIDLNSNRIGAFIDLATPPLGMAVLE